MAKADIGPKIGIDGEREFKKQIKEINGNLKELGSEMKVVTSEFIGNEHSVEALTASNRQLEQTSAALSEKMAILRQRLDEYAQAGQLSSDSARKLQIELNNTTAQYNANEAQIKKNNEEIRDLTEAQDENGESAGGLSKVLQAFGIDLGGVSKALGLSREQTTMLSDALGGAGGAGAGGGMSLAVGAAAAAAAVALAAEAIKEIAGFMKEAITDAAAYADEIGTISTNYHIATDTLQEYQYMAELTDTSLDTITGSIAKLTKNMDAARDGSGSAAEAFTKLSIRVTDSNGELRDANEVFLEAIHRLGYISNETERDAIAMALFGKSAMELNSLIETGTDGIAAYAEEARRMGYVLTDDQLAALEAVDDEFARFDNQMTAIKNQIAAEMAPALLELAQQLLEVAQTVDWPAFGRSAAAVIRELTPMIIDLANAVASAANAIAGLINAGQAIKSSSSNTGVLYRNDGTIRTTGGAAASSAPINVAVQLDSQTIARATYDANRAENNRIGNHAIR